MMKWNRILSESLINKLINIENVRVASWQLMDIALSSLRRTLSRWRLLRYLKGVCWVMVGLIRCILGVLVFKRFAAQIIFLMPRLRSARRNSSIPTWRKSSRLLTIEVKSDLKLLPGIVSPYTTASLASFWSRIPLFYVILFRSLRAFAW